MKIIELGSQEAEVIVLQRLLFKLDYAIECDSIFGTQTLDALSKFQTSNNIEPNGIVGDITWSALFDNIKDKKIEGLDISHYDFEDGKMVDLGYVAQNFWFCYTKGTEGSNSKDKTFKPVFRELESKQFLRGVYHFFRFGNIEDEINNFMNLGIDYSQKGVLPPVLDIETALPNGLSLNEATTGIKTWLETIEQKTGKKPIIYTSYDKWDNILKSPKGFETYPLWVASYTTNMVPKMPSGWKNSFIWQYTPSGTVKGATGVDLDHCSLTCKQLLELAGFN